MAKEKKEFHVAVCRTSYGYVRVSARNKNEARQAVESMNKKKLLTFYKHSFDFVKIGEATIAEAKDD